MTIYKGVHIYQVDDENGTYYEFGLGGWIHQFKTLDECKEEINQW